MNATFENPVDRENHIVRGVKVLGFTSANGRIYDFAAVKEAIQKYEKAPVNKDHNMEEPSFSDRLGWLENVILEKDGLYADFHYNPHADGIESFLWFAEHNGLGDVGFSHLVSGKYSVDPDGTERITRIDNVRSVDLVANPATTKTIFESEVKPMKKKISESSFYRLPKSDIGNTLYEAKMALDSFYSSAKNGNDIKPDYLNNIISLLNNVKKNIKSFNKPDEVKGTVYESDDKPMPKKVVKEADADVPEKFPVGKKLLVYFTRSLPNQKGLSDSTLSTSFQSKFSYDNWIRQNKNKVDIVSIKWVGASNNKGSESLKESNKSSDESLFKSGMMSKEEFEKKWGKPGKKDYNPNRNPLLKKGGLYGNLIHRGKESMKENDSDFKIVEKMSGTKDDQVSKREKTYDLYYKGKFIGWVDDLAKAWRIEKEYANKKGSESMKEAEKEKGLEVYGTKGMKNTRFRKTFKSQKEYEKWYDKNEGDIEILGLRDLEGDSKHEQEDVDDSGLTDKEKADNLRAAKLQDRKMAASRRKNSGDDDGRRGYGPTGTTRTNRARRRESVKEAKQHEQEDVDVGEASNDDYKNMNDRFDKRAKFLSSKGYKQGNGKFAGYFFNSPKRIGIKSPKDSFGGLIDWMGISNSDIMNMDDSSWNNGGWKNATTFTGEQEGDDEMDKEKLMEEENPMQQEEAEQDPMMDEADDVYSKIKEVCEGEGSDEEKSKQVLEMLGLSGGMSEAEDDEEMKEDDDEETKEQDSEVLENDDEEMKEDDDEDPRKESKSELKSLRKWKSEKLKQEKIVNLIKESNLEPTRVFVKQLSAIDSKLWGEAIRDRKKVALTRSAVKPISSGSQSRSELSYKQFLESVLGK